ncbi:hypothetical protein GCM10011390_06450 [Aureimonas endophytica]|uniref:DUF2336 domain-containing protein n=1 Tax=Aureimonas endophytica TaxID=2027858 RepID=A0A917E0A5_9HYPH|nr:DUF2336 domain-containing protein [Aureimonas endophytica]GGD90402.1 hypothetical protein GCM10011390_06450 [Aureimonas endophytica]
MTLQRFVDWCDNAGTRQRAEGFAMLARAYLDGHVPQGDRRAVEAFLHLVLDDPSPKVRAAVAAVMGRHRAAPPALLRAFLFDCQEVALFVAAAPALGDGDLADALASAGEALQAAIADRPDLAVTVAEAIAAEGCRAAVIALLRNDALDLGDGVLRRLAHRFGRDPEIRALLTAGRLPVDSRQMLILEAADALQSAPLVQAVLGERTAALVFEASERATAGLAETVEPAEMPRLVAHLQSSGQISPAFLIRAACLGNVDLVAAALAALSNLSEQRVRAVLVECREAAFQTLATRSGLSPSVGEIIRLALRCWKGIATGRVELGPEEAPDFVLAYVIQGFGAKPRSAEDEKALALLRRIQREAAREGMRLRAGRLLAA